MNQDLKQRLIGAVVVTALAAIFIPMLFDDPIDERSQLVTELDIPKEPAIAEEILPNKPPANTDQVLKAPEGQASEEITEQALNAQDEPMDSEAVADNLDEEETEQAAGNPDAGQAKRQDLDSPVAEEEELEKPVNKAAKAVSKQDSAVDSLDTGVVAKLNSTVTRNKSKPVVAAKPLETGATATPKSTLRKNEAIIAKQTPLTKPVSVASADRAVKPSTKTIKANPELARWYIQAGTFSKKENAFSLRDNLLKQGLPVLLETIQIPGKGSLYRLKVGPELDKKRVTAMKAKLDQQNIKNILVSE